MAALIAHGLEIRRQIAGLRNKYAEVRRARAVASLARCAS